MALMAGERAGRRSFESRKGLTTLWNAPGQVFWYSVLTAAAQDMIDTHERSRDATKLTFIKPTRVLTDLLSKLPSSNDNLSLYHAWGADNLAESASSVGL